MFTIYDNEKEEYQKVEEPDPSYGYTYEDYLTWNFLERLELIKGRIFKLSAPNPNHQLVSGQLYLYLRNFLGASTCRVFSAPFDVRLPKPGKTGDRQITTVVQPDISVVCDKSKIDGRGCCGAPDLVVEVLSPGNSAHEVRVKYELYEQAGVREYWLVNAYEENLFVYLLNEESKYGGGKMYAAGDVITSAAVSGFSIQVTDIFADKIKDL